MTTRKRKKRGRHAKPLRACTKTDFGEKIVLLWIAFDKASRDCIAFEGVARQDKSEGMSTALWSQIHDSYRDKEMVTLKRLEDELKRRRFDVQGAMTQLERLRPTARQSREPAPTPRRTRSKTTN